MYIWDVSKDENNTIRTPAKYDEPYALLHISFNIRIVYILWNEFIAIKPKKGQTNAENAKTIINKLIITAPMPLTTTLTTIRWIKTITGIRNYRLIVTIMATSFAVLSYNMKFRCVYISSFFNRQISDTFQMMYTKLLRKRPYKPNLHIFPSMR